MYHQKVDCEV